MRKNTLIKLLTSIKGNPDIVLWNGLVGDYQDIDSELIEGSLVKQTLKEYIESYRAEQCVAHKDWEFKFSPDRLIKLEQQYKTACHWEHNPFIDSTDIETKRYKSKKVMYIQPKIKGETYIDRVGKITY